MSLNTNELTLSVYELVGRKTYVALKEAGFFLIITRLCMTTAGRTTVRFIDLIDGGAAFAGGCKKAL